MQLHEVFIFLFRTLGRAWKQLKAKLQDEANAHQSFAVKVTHKNIGSVVQSREQHYSMHRIVILYGKNALKNLKTSFSKVLLLDSISALKNLT